MNVKTIPVGPLATNCYILVEGNRCLIIDPGDEGERVLNEARAAMGTPVPAEAAVQAILFSHGHFDHTMAAGYLQKETGAPVYVGAKDRSMTVEPGWMKDFMPSACEPPADLRTLSEGDLVVLGDVVLDVWETPGHSPGSLTFVVHVEASDPNTPMETAAGAPASLSKMAFCGDLIFRRGVGRTDLPGGDQDALFESVDRVLGLPGDTSIYPGHGPATTVRREKASSPFA